VTALLFIVIRKIFCTNFSAIGLYYCVLYKDKQKSDMKRIYVQYSYKHAYVFTIHDLESPEILNEKYHHVENFEKHS
jgi:hypothetical protein